MEKTAAIDCGRQKVSLVTLPLNYARRSVSTLSLSVWRKVFTDSSSLCRSDVNVNVKMKHKTRNKNMRRDKRRKQEQSRRKGGTGGGGGGVTNLL